MIEFPLVLLYRLLVPCHLKLHPQRTKGLHLPPNEQKFLPLDIVKIVSTMGAIYFLGLALSHLTNKGNLHHPHDTT